MSLCCYYIPPVTQMKTKKGTIAMLGYGSQGRALACNLRDSGYDILVGLRSRSPGRKAARSDGFERILTINRAVKNADCLCFALPDHLHGRIFARDIRPNMKRRATLIFLHGFSVHFGTIKPPATADVIMIAPHAPGIMVREKYLADRSLSAFWAVYQNPSGRAARVAAELAAAMGFRKSRLVKTTFEKEAVGDLFGEQAVLCGGLSELVLGGFEVLVEKGLSPENAYLEVAYQLDLIIGLIKRYGVKGMYDRISVTARYGSAMSGKKIIGESVKRNMLNLYDDIASGEFARELNSLTDKDIARLGKLIRSLVNPAFDRAALKYSK